MRWERSDSKPVVSKQELSPIQLLFYDDDKSSRPRGTSDECLTCAKTEKERGREAMGETDVNLRQIIFNVKKSNFATAVQNVLKVFASFRER